MAFRGKEGGRGVVRKEEIEIGKDRKIKLSLSLPLPGATLRNIKICVYKSFKTLIHGGLGGGFSSCHPISGSTAALFESFDSFCPLGFLERETVLSFLPSAPASTIGNLQLGISLFASHLGQILRAGPAPPFLAGKDENKEKKPGAQKHQIGIF